jgi:hypothetical protein
MNKCEHCEKPVEAEQYTKCYDCWWDRDPRNVKNGGTVDLGSFGKPKEKKNMIVNSMNNRFICEPYKGDRALKAVSSNGFAIVQQKVNIVGLKVLVDAVIFCGAMQGISWPKGSVVHIKEELLFTQQWAQKVYESSAVEGKFIIVDASQVEFVSFEQP